VIIVVFISAENNQTSVLDVHSALDALGVVPLTKNDIFNVLINPFVEKYATLLDYARKEVGVKEDGSKGMGPSQVRELVEELAVKCLEVGCKVRSSYSAFPTILTPRLRESY
jgi:hypothetical protein